MQGFADDGIIMEDSAPAPGAGQKPQTSTKVRTEFPETWLWSETTAG